MTADDPLESTRKGLEAMRNAPVEPLRLPVMHPDDLEIMLDQSVERIEHVDFGGGRLARVVFRRPKPVPVRFNIISDDEEPNFGEIEEVDSSDG